MNKLKIMTAAGAATLMAVGAMATSASAQPSRYYDRDYGVTYETYGNRLTTSYVDSLEWKIDNAARNRVISWGEARNLKAELRQIQPLAYRVQTGQASRWEVRRLNAGVNRIEAATTRYAYNDRYPRPYRY